MDQYERSVAIVGVGAILPDAPNVEVFWQNILNKRYSISEVPHGRWGIADYYDADPRTPDKSYSKIGGWIKDFEFDWKRFRIPPKVAAAIDLGQQWGLTIAADALDDYGYPERPLNTERTAVIIGTAMGGEQHYHTTMRINFPEFAETLKQTDGFQELPSNMQTAIMDQWHETFTEHMPEITEDTMPGELPNIVSGRIANVLNLRGPNFITDAACASSMAAIETALEMLSEHKVDAVVTGGVDRNMGASTFIKFCKIGALSATGTRPFGDGADGFVMGEGAAVFLLKRLEDAERDGDKIYAVIRGVGGASDGKGKGITAPNPIGQQLAMERAWETAGVDPSTVSLLEAHGTSTRVGDVVEVESLNKVFGQAKNVGLGSVKSNIGHLKAGAGAAGLLKATLALHHKILPPTINAEKANPNIDFAATPFHLLNEAKPWSKTNGSPRRAGVSAYGFGGTNFHIVLEEYVPGAIKQEADAQKATQTITVNGQVTQPAAPQPIRGILAIGAATPAALKEKVDAIFKRVESGWTPPMSLPTKAERNAPERLFIDFGDHEELLGRLQRARKVLGFDTPEAWNAVQAQGIFRGSGKPTGKLAFMFPGQGSQYINMGKELAEKYPIVAQTLAEADAVMEPILGKPLTSYLFVDPQDKAAMNQAVFDLMQTAITQPAMLTLDTAIYRLLEQFGFEPDMVIGHSLGEYAGLIAAGILPFAEALEASAARGREMSALDMPDNGKMAAVMAPYDVVVEILQELDGYAVPANINSRSQCVIGGNSDTIDQAIALFAERGYDALALPVSHAFHTSIVAPASAPLRQVLNRLHVGPPQLPLVANVTGEFYPTGIDAIKDLLEKQIASPVQWVKGIQTLYGAGVRFFLEVGPKRALRGFANDIFKGQKEVTAMLTNHPKTGELPAFNQALCSLYAAGYGMAQEKPPVAPEPQQIETVSATNGNQPAADNLNQLTELLAQALQQNQPQAAADQPQYDRNRPPAGSIVISGTGLGLPGAEKSVMDPENALRILRGEQFIDLIPERFRHQMVDKQIVRIVKSEDGSGSFATIDDRDDVIKLAGRPGFFDLTEEYGVPEKLVEALDVTTQLAIAAGIDALREAGIPLVQTYKRTTTGRYLPERWLLPEALRDETGVIFASAFPGGDRFADEFNRYYTHQNRLDQLNTLEDLRRYTQDNTTLQEINRRISTLRMELEAEPYNFDRRFIFRILAMGHSQFAQYIGARGPNTHVNAACASTAQAVAVAEDWIRSGRCKRVIVIGGDDVTGDNLMEWVGAGFLSVGAATTHDKVDEAALPFDRRRHGTILGMGACGLVVESQDAVQERGMRGIVELLSSETSNSAFHGTRLDVDHISMVLEHLVSAAERRFGINRYAIAPQTVFVSHETFTPARGGSASAEVIALRETFGDSASDIIMANTKGFTGHPMGVGVEDVIAIKILEHGIVPPVPNFKEVDPDLGPLNLSRGGRYPVQYAVHLAAGFGSQIAFTFLRRIPGGLKRVDNQPRYQRWLDDVSGYNYAQTEVVKRVLRIKAEGAPPRPPAPSSWQYGTGPTIRTPFTADASTATATPARMVLPETKPAVANQVAPSRNDRPVPPQPKVEPPPAPAPVAQVTQQPVAPPPPQPKPAAVVSEPPPATAEVIPVQEEVDGIASQVLDIVATQTGYPSDMLDLDLDMEADLGIDTVKQAETFAAIRETFDIPRRDDLRLRDYPTLEAVIGFVKEMRPELVQTVVTAPPVVSAAPAVSAPPAASSPPPAADGIEQKVLAIVAEQTGYPVEMLEFDLDMEADLGIDTVKQAETFAAIRETFDIPRRDDLRLRDYPTLEAVIGFVKEMRPELVQTIAVEPPVANPTPTVNEQPAGNSQHPATNEVEQKVLAIVADQTGYPIEMLEFDLDMEADLGIDTVKQAETFAAIRETFDIPRRDDLRLRDYPTLEAVIGFVKEMRPELAQATPTAPAIVNEAPAVSQQPAANRQPPAADEVEQKVLAIVADQTGYPIEMLEFDLDMEADLGIDTVKQAETFAAIRETFDIPRRDDLKLRDYPTLEAVIGFVKEMRPELTATSSQKPAASSEASAASNPQPAADLSTADQMPRRVPTPMVRPALEWCKPTGVTLDANSRIIIMPDRGGVSKALFKRLEKRGVTTLVADPRLDQEALETQIKGWLAEGDIQGVYWLPALDIEPALEEIDWSVWKAETHGRVKLLYTTMRTLYEAISESGAFLVSGTRLGGLHGYGSDGATAPLGGAVTGFTKAYKRERPEVLVKAVDFAVSRKTAALADQLIAETLTDPGVVEVGYVNDQRYTITLTEQPVADGQPGLTLDQETVFLVTGAAGGITSAIVADLAAASGGIFYLLDLVEAPTADDEEVMLFRNDQDALREKLVAAAKADGKRPTPVVINKYMMAIERREAALRAVEAVVEAGGTAHYRSVDLLDDAAVRAAVDEIRERYGRIDALVHAGGIEISKGLADKPAEQFDLVFDIKADGFFSLLKAAADMPIGATVVFSSVAGRFGNSGQTDYSAANDLLCKISSSLRNWRPETRGIALDWTAWGGIGMATRGSIPTIMKAAGIDMLPPEVGIPTVRRELVSGGFSGEIVVGGALGMMMAEFDESGGLDTDKFKAALAERDPTLMMIGEVKAAKLYGGLEVETTLDPNQQPFLYDHAPDEGTPWLPGVMGTEAMVQLATALLPDYQVIAVENEAMLGAFKFFRMETQTLYLSGVLQPDANGDVIVQTMLRSVRQPKREGLPTQVKVHYTADVRLRTAAEEPPVMPFEPPQAFPITAEAIYEQFFHGPAYQVLSGAVVDQQTAVGVINSELPADTDPAEAVLLMHPRLVEGCFQAAALWSIEVNKAMAFPLGFEQLQAYHQLAEAQGKLYAIVETADGGQTFDGRVVDEAGQLFVELVGYRTVGRPDDDLG